MSDFFTATQRKLQHEFASTELADRLVEAAVNNELSDQQAQFIHSRNMFYLATIDEVGFPSCSYKGGNNGFARGVGNGGGFPRLQRQRHVYVHGQHRRTSKSGTVVC